MASSPEPRLAVRQTSRAAQWAALIGATVVAVLALDAWRVPAAVLIGPLAVGIVFALGGATVRPVRPVKLSAQAVIGTAVAIALAPAVGPDLASRVLLLLVIGSATLGLALGLAILAARVGGLSPATAVWGLAPGSAAAMVAFAEASGGDARKVALMQYSRIVIVAFATLAVAHGLTHAEIGQAHRIWLPDLSGVGILSTAALSGAAVIASLWTRIGILALLAPILVGTVAAAAGVPFQAPPLLTALAYAIIGWNIGLSFTRSSLRDNLRSLPVILGGAVALIVGCAGLGLIVGRVFHLDPLSAYLATSPGGIDAMLIIAASVPVDLPLILAAQLTRFLMVIALARPIGAFLADRLGPAMAAPSLGDPR